MATEAFDPFAVDDEDDDDLLHGATTTTPRHSNSSVRYSPKVIPSPRGSPRSRDRASGNTSVVSSSSPRGNKRTDNAQPDRQIDDILGEFHAAFPPASAFNDDDAEVDEFGFPSVDFAAAFGVGAVDEAHARDTSSTYPGSRPSLEGVTFILSEEMSIIHKSKTNECSVKVRGNLLVRAIRDWMMRFVFPPTDISHRNFTPAHPSSFVFSWRNLPMQIAISAYRATYPFVIPKDISVIFPPRKNRTTHDKFRVRT
jgi:hypothetical protein